MTSLKEHDLRALSREGLADWVSDSGLPSERQHGRYGDRW